MASPKSNKYVVASLSAYVGNSRPNPSITLLPSVPASGIVGTPSNNFTVNLVNGIAPTRVTFSSTPSSTIVPGFAELTPASPTAYFTVNALSAAVHTVSLTNNKGISNPAPVIYTSAPAPSFATAFTLTGPTTGTNGVASTFTVTPTGGQLASAMTVNITAAGATLSTASLSFSSGATAAQTFTVNRATTGSTSVSITNTGGLTNSGTPINYSSSAAATATAFTLTGPTTGTTGSPSTFTVTPTGGPLGSAMTVNITAAGATLSVASLSFSSGATTAQTFTVNRATNGTTSVSITNTGGLTNTGSPIAYTSTAGASPPPPPAPGTTLATLTLHTAGAGNYPFSVGHAFKPGDVPAEILAGLQCNVKSRWPDGSLKIAILSGSFTAASSTTTLNIGTGIPPLVANLTIAQLKATNVAASFGSDAYGSASWATGSSDWDTPFLVWAEGPYCLTLIYRKPFSSDSHLTAWMEVRYFGGTDVEVLPWVENAYLYQASPGLKPGAFTFSLGGTTRFDSSTFATPLNVGHHTRQPLLYGAGLSYWLNTNKSVVPKHDAAYLATTGLVSKYLADMNSSAELNVLPSIDAGVSIEFTPWADGTVDNSNFPTVMGAGGGHKSIGIQPAWEALALTRTTPRAWEQMIRESFRFGRYSTHFRDENTNRPFRFSQHPQVSVNNANVNAIKDAMGGGSAPVPTPTGAVPHPSAMWAPSHQPASPLLAYITSGRYFFMEECQFIATANYMQAAPAFRSNSAGIFNSRSVSGFSMETRKVAWCLRNLFIAACVTPDDDVLKAEFDSSVQSNIDMYHTAYIASPSNPYGLVETGDRSFVSGTSSGMVAGGAQSWQYAFFTAAWGRAAAWRLGTSREVRKKGREFFSWVAKSIVGRLGTTAATEWLYRDLSAGLDPYDFPSNPRLSWIWPGKNITVTHDFGGGSDTTTGTYPDYAGGTGPWWDSWGQMYDHMIVTQAGLTKVDGDLRGGYIPDPDANFWNEFQAIVAAVSMQEPDAAAGWNRVKTNPLWSSYMRGRDIGRYGTNSLDNVTLALESFADIIPATGQRNNANLNDAYAADFEKASGWAPGNVQSRWWLGFGATSGGNIFQDTVQAYSGTTWAPEYGAKGAFVLNGGSDGAQLAQVNYLFDFDSMAWRSVGAPANLPPNFEWANYYWNGSVYEQRPSNGDPRIPPSTEARDPVFYDYMWNGSYIKLANHSYLHNFYVPESKGGGKNGSLGLPCSSYSHDRGDADPRNGKVDTFTPHLMNLSTGKGVRAVTAPVANAGDTDGFKGFTQTNAVRDTQRDRIWFFRNGGSQAHYLTLSSGPPYTSTDHTVQKVSGGTFGWIPTANSTWIYVEDADCMVGFVPNNSNSIPPGIANAPLYTYIFSMSTGVPVALHNDDAFLPPAQVMPYGGVMVGAAWVPSSVVGGVGKFYLYEGFGDTFCYTLTPSTLNFATCTWTWGKESFSGASPVFKNAPDLLDGQRLAVQGKWQYVPALGCLAWHDGPNTSGVCVDGVTRQGIVQLWRPPGTPI